MSVDFISLVIGLVIGLLAAAVYFVPRLPKKGEQEKAEEALKNAFAVTAQEALRQSNEQFLQLAQEKLKHAQADGSHDLEKRQKAISEMVGPVKEHLTRLNSVVEQIQGTDKALRDDLKSLQRETAKLAGAMRDPAAQGRWGEFILERLLDKSGLIKGVHYETQVTMSNEGSRQRPDVVIKLQDGFNIVIDAKAPVNEFTERLQEDIPEAEYKEMLDKLARLIRDHVKKLGQKTYWENLDSPDFVVMFLPSEHLFSAALRADPNLVDFAAENRIVIASPTLMISLVRVVGLSWRQVELAKNAQDISALGAELYKRVSVFGDHMDKVGRGLTSALNSYNSAVGSLERSVLSSARKLKDLHVQDGGKEIAELTPLDKAPRLLNNSALTNDDEDTKSMEEADSKEAEELA